MLVITYKGEFDDVLNFSSLKQYNTIEYKNLHKTFSLLLFHFKMAV